MILRQADKQEEQNKILTKQLEHMIEKEGTSKNWFKNLHESSIQIILFASALDNDKIPDKPVDSLKRIKTEGWWLSPNRSSTTSLKPMA